MLKWVIGLPYAVWATFQANRLRRLMRGWVADWKARGSPQSDIEIYDLYNTPGWDIYPEEHDDNWN
jgi:hypothetical protein